MELFKSGEDYLERILILRNKLGNVRSIDIVNDMHFSKPSVSIAMKKLKESDFITFSHDGFIFLTKKGEEIASKMYERHVLLTKWLVTLGVDDKIAREDACKIEHDLSVKTFEAIKKYLNK